jgi:hypothetical protein
VKLPPQVAAVPRFPLPGREAGVPVGGLAPADAAVAYHHAQLSAPSTAITHPHCPRNHYWCHCPNTDYYRCCPIIAGKKTACNPKGSDRCACDVEVRA